MRLHGLTAPDHTPYLLPTDLRTAEDAAAFVRTYVVDPATEWDLSDVYNYLERRLDRERRQACRRGALAAWRRFCDETGNVDWTGESLDVWGNRRRALDTLSRALAFRAAARAK